MGVLLTQVTVSLGSLGQAACSSAGSRESAAGSSLGCGALLLCMTRSPAVTAQASGERAARGKRPDSRYVSPLRGPPSWGSSRASPGRTFFQSKVYLLC